MKTLLIAFSFFISMGIHPFVISVFSQNITNTLGPNGVFTIKDASNNYLTLSQSTGQVHILRSFRLENTTSSSLGILFKGTNRFLHNYGTNNTFLGINSGNFTMTGTDNTALGDISLTSNTSGSFNTAVGWMSLHDNTTGRDNIAVGYRTLENNTSGGRNIALGNWALSSNTTGGFNSAMGNNSLINNATGSINTAMGYNSLFNNTTGSENTGVGDGSLYFNTTGRDNTALGRASLFSNAANSNTAVGYFSLFSNTTGNSNTALGDSAGYFTTTGSNLTLIGNNAQPTSGSANNQITLGNNQVTSLRCNVTTITSLSDARDKKNITDLSFGLDFLMKIKPRLFNWDKREWYENNISDGSKMKEAPTAGFIAQELDDVQTTACAEWLNLVLKDNPEKLEATSGNLLPVMVKAIQELNKENENLEVRLAKVESLKTENDKLKSEVESLKSMNEKIVKLEKIVSELTSIKLSSFNKTIETKQFQKKEKKK